MRAPPAEYLRLDLRAHDLLRDVPLYDVSIVDLPGGGAGRSVGDIRALESAAAPSRVANTIYGLRHLLGRVVGWDHVQIRPEDSLLSRLSEQWGVGSQEQYASLHRFAVTQRDLFSTQKMSPGARRYLRRLSDKGYRIRIITHRLTIRYFHGAAVRQTIDWLDYHGIPYWDLCFMKEKDQVGADIYVDDTPENLDRLRSGGHFAICFANSTNRHLPAPRAASWRAVYQLIKSREPMAMRRAGSKRRGVTRRRR